MLIVAFPRSLREKKKPSGSSGKIKKPHYLEDAMKFLIPFTNHHAKMKMLNPLFRYTEVNDKSEMSARENNGMHNSDDGKNTPSEQE